MKSLFNENLIINIKTKIFIKKKLLSESFRYLQIYSKSETLIILDNFLKFDKVKLNYIKKSLKFLKKKEFIFNYSFEPSFDDLKNIKSKIKNKKINLIIAIGGGSTLDIGKGLSITLKYAGRIEKLQGQDKFSQSTIPVVSIPTIFGSGAEITPSAVFINKNTNIKGGINSPLIQPVISLIDLYLAKPKNYKQHVICAFDGLVHAIESYHSTLSNNFTKFMAINGASFILSGIDKIKSDKYKALENIAEGSIYSIISLMHSEQNITGASSYPLAIYYGYNHAYCGASFLEKSILIINKKNPYLFHSLINELKFKKIIREKSVNSLVQKLQSIKKEYKIKNIILEDKQISKVANQTKTMSMLNTSPVKFSLKDIKSFLKY